MGHSLRNTNLTISGSFSIQDGSERANYMLISDERGKTSWSKPADYISTNPDGHYIGELFGGGVVVAVWKESGIEKCLIAGPENLCTTSTNPYSAFHFRYGISWSSSDVAVTTYRNFGASNSNNISATFPGSAAKMCLDYINPNLGTGVWDDWFLPSIGELRHLMNNAAIFNKVMEAYARDTARPTRDKVVKQVFGGDGRVINSVFPTDINLITTRTNTSSTGFEPSGTRFTETTLNQAGTAIIGTVSLISDDEPYYWSSTGALAYSSGRTYLDLASGIWGGFGNDRFLDRSTLCKVRPFRIGDDTQTSIVFDADWAVLTYVFSGEKDLDTRSTMITPYRTDSQRGFGAEAYNSWAPAGINSPSTGFYTNTVPPEGLAANGTFSVLWHAGDNTGTGYESVLIGLSAFKYYFPGQTEIEIDTRAHWYVGNFDNPAWEDTSLLPPDGLGIRQSMRLERTNPVVMRIELYKGGTASKNPIDPFQWTISGYSASYSVGSYGKVVNDVYPGNTIDGVTTSNQSAYPSGVRVARFKYNVVGKFGKIIID